MQQENARFILILDYYSINLPLIVLTSRYINPIYSINPIFKKLIACILLVENGEKSIQYN